MSHTPGPWKVMDEEVTADGCYLEPEVVAEEDEKTICVIRIGLEGSMANARLIAAAPELLQMVRDFIWKLEPEEESQPQGGIYHRAKALLARLEAS